jgi:hypothetical protein
LRILSENWNDIGRPIGLGAFLYHLCSRTVQVLSRGAARFVIYRLYVQPLVKDEGPLRTHYRCYEVTPGSQEEKLGQCPQHILDMRRRLGYRCFALTFKGEQVGYAWFATKGEFLEDELRLDYQMFPHDRLVWDFDVFVAEKWRAGRAFQQLWLGCSQALRAQGFECSASRIHLNNVNSVLSHEKLGATVVSHVLVLKYRAFELSVQSAPFSVGLGSSDRKQVKIVSKH